MKKIVKAVARFINCCVEWFVAAVMKLLHMKDDKKLEYIRAVKFLLVGVANTAVDWIVFAIMADVFHVAAAPSQAVSYFVGAVNSFLCNKYFTFRARNKITFLECAQFLIVTAIAIGISTGVVYLLDNQLGWNKYIAKGIATIVSFAVNFVGNRFVVFRKQAEAENERESNKGGL